MAIIDLLNWNWNNAWIRYTCGRLESRLRYEPAIYNNFPWPLQSPDSEQNMPHVRMDQARTAIEIEAQAVLDARAAFPASSLADLYDPLTMPPALLKAHHRLDAAVDKAYQLSGGPKSYAGDAERVAFLFTLYQRLTSLLPAEGAARRRAPRARKATA